MTRPNRIEISSDGVILCKREYAVKYCPEEFGKTVLTRHVEDFVSLPQGSIDAIRFSPASLGQEGM